MVEKRTKSVRLEWNVGSDGTGHGRKSDDPTTSSKDDSSGNGMGKLLEYEVLATNEFDATRKCMSVLLREASGTVRLMVKGADTAILPACVLTAEERSRLDQVVSGFAHQSLRTLVLAEKVVPENEATAWLKRFNEVTLTLALTLALTRTLTLTLTFTQANAVVGLDAREDALMNVAMDIEKNLSHLAITAIEDELQDDCPAVIADLLKAGIVALLTATLTLSVTLILTLTLMFAPTLTQTQTGMVVWMLTGDKEETAVQIGYSTKLIPPHATVCFMTKVTLT